MNRVFSSCELIKDKDGQQVVLIVGGYERGMELWNPQTNEVKLLSDVIPPEGGGSYGIRAAEILPINDRSELIFYGGVKESDSDSDEIWKYTVDTNSWTKYFVCLFY